MSGATSILATGPLAADGAAGVKSAASFRALLSKPGGSPTEKADRASQESFLSVLSQHVKDGTASKPFESLTPAQKTERTKQAAEELVAVAFVQPILKNLRGGGVMGEMPAPFGPGAGEKQFRGIADAQMARHLVHASRWGLVDSLTKKLLKPSRNSGKQVSKQEIATADALPGSPAAKRRAKDKTLHAGTSPFPAHMPASLVPPQTGSTIDTLH